MRPEKQLLLEEIRGQIERSKALIFTRYQALSPNIAHELREMILKSGGNFEVVRKRVLMKAASAQGITLSLHDLQGHLAIVFAEDDPARMAKSLSQFIKERENILEVIGGHFEGRLCSARDVQEIAELPSKDEMRAQFLSVLEAPQSQTLAVMDAALASVIHCLNNKSQQT